MEVAVEIAVDPVVEIAVEIVIASAIGLHGVTLLAVAFRGSPWNVRGSPWKVRGSPWDVRGYPWNGMDMALERRGGPWTLPRWSAKETSNIHPLAHLSKQGRDLVADWNTVVSSIDEPVSSAGPPAAKFGYPALVLC